MVDVDDEDAECLPSSTEDDGDACTSSLSLTFLSCLFAMVDVDDEDAECLMSSTEDDGDATD
eukprot:9241818-Ditylum_brightwellii.AAC.1